MKSYGVTIQMKATKQYFPVVLFIVLYEVVLTFESVNEILKCDYSNESYWAVYFKCALICMFVFTHFQKNDNFFSQLPLLGLTCSKLFIYVSPIGAAPIFIVIINALDSFIKGITVNLPKQRVYLGVRT